MDRQLAQRMVGAACLLAVLVVVVPAILDGNPDSGGTLTHPAVDDSLDLRTHTIRLDGEEREPPVPTPLQGAVGPESGLNAQRAPVESPAPAAVKTPETEGESDSKPESEPKSESRREPVRELAREPVARAVVAPASPAATTANGGNWIVQLGSFSQRANADRLAADVERKGFSVSIEPGGGASGNLFRVRAGPVADRPAAEALAGQLAAAGFSGGRVGQR